MIIPFAEWRPDSPNVGDGFAVNVQNAIPQPGGYVPVETLTEYSTSVLDAYCRGAYYKKSSETTLYMGTESFLFVRTSGTSFVRSGKSTASGTTEFRTDGGGDYMENVSAPTPDFTKFSAGESIFIIDSPLVNFGSYTVKGSPTATKLYINETWADNLADGDADVYKEYQSATTSRWNFTQWDDTIIATNYDDDPQSDVSGVFDDLTTALRFRYVAVIKDFVVVGDTFDATDGAVPYRVRWCAQGDPTDWTVSASTLADYNDMVGPGGDVTQVVGGEYGVIFQEAAITRMTFVGSPVVFQFDRVSDSVGCQVPGSVIKVGGTIFFLSVHGFMALDDATSLRPIGHGKIDATFFAEFDTTGAHLMSATEWPERNCVIWAYRTTSGSGNVCDKMLVYNYQTDQWGSIVEDVELVVAVPKTSQIRPTLAAFNTSHKLAFFEGTDMAARLETAEFEPIPGARALLKSVRPMIRNGAGTLIIRQRDALTESLASATASTILSASQRFGTRKSGRYFTLRWDTVSNWQRAVGLDCDFVPRGRR